MIRQEATWDVVEVGGYVEDKTGAAWKVLAIERPLNIPMRAQIQNRAGQTAIIPVARNMPIVQLVPTMEEALTTLRGVFPNAEEITHG